MRGKIGIKDIFQDKEPSFFYFWSVFWKKSIIFAEYYKVIKIRAKNLR